MNIAVHPFIMGQPHRIDHLARALEYIRACMTERPVDPARAALDELRMAPPMGGTA